MTYPRRVAIKKQPKTKIAGKPTKLKKAWISLTLMLLTYLTFPQLQESALSSASSKCSYHVLWLIHQTKQI